MRWFKHLSESRRDEKIAKLIQKGGLEYYALWWITLEIIAEKMDKTDRCWVEFPIKVWANFSQTSTRKWSNFIQTMEKLGLCEMIISKNFAIIKIPNLLKYKDEYTKKSGQTPDKLPKKSGQTPDQDTENRGQTEFVPTETDLKPPIIPLKKGDKKSSPIPYQELALECWDAYPPTKPGRNVKQIFFRQWKNRMAEQEDPNLILVCIQNFAESRKGEDFNFTKSIQVFIGRDRHYLEFRPRPKKEEPKLTPEQTWELIKDANCINRFISDKGKVCLGKGWSPFKPQNIDNLPECKFENCYRLWNGKEFERRLK